MIITKVSSIGQNKQQNKVSFGTQFGYDLEQMLHANIDHIDKTSMAALKALKNDGKNHRMLDVLFEKNCFERGGCYFNECLVTLFLKIRGKRYFIRNTSIASSSERSGQSFSEFKKLKEDMNVETLDLAEKSKTLFKTQKEIKEQKAQQELRKALRANMELKKKAQERANKEKDLKKILT